jgi:DNA polymerase-3 subunit gamma/tau
MAAMVGCPSDLLLHTSAAEHPGLAQLGTQLGLETLLAVAQILDQTLVRMRQSTHVRTLLELALVRICKLEDLDQLPQVVAQLRDGLPPTASASPRTTPAAKPAAAPNPPPAASAEKKTPALEPDDSPVTPSVHTAPPELPSAADAEEAWRQTLAEFQDMTGQWASKYQSVAISAPNRLVVSFPKDYTSAKEFCERPEKRSRLELALSRLTGRDMRIDFAVLADESQASVPQPVATRPTATRQQRNAAARRNPLVRKAEQLFDAEIVTVIDPQPLEADGAEAAAAIEPAV